MPAPLAKGLIIAASVLVAAGIAIYESPQVRAWVDQQRRKIAIALHSLGDEVAPRRPSESSNDFEARKRRREEIVRRNRNDLIKRAREEGVAVDLDELARINQDVEDVEREVREMNERKVGTGIGRSNSAKSFDELVGSDGMLRKDIPATTSGRDAGASGMRQRGTAGFAAGSLLAGNPFDDSNATMLFDHDEKEAPAPKDFDYIEPGTRETSATLDGQPVSGDLIDLTPEELAFVQDMTPAFPDRQQVQATQDPELSQPDDNEGAAQSFYSFTSEPAQPQTPSHIDVSSPITLAAEDEVLSAGTLTPRSEHSGSETGASLIGSNADDIGVLSMHDNDEHDARSEVFSEGGFTDAGFSEAGFSEVGSQRQGVMTPNSWTDVGSDDESEWGGNQGHVSQIHQ